MREICLAYKAKRLCPGICAPRMAQVIRAYGFTYFARFMLSSMDSTANLSSGQRRDAYGLNKWPRMCFFNSSKTYAVGISGTFGYLHSCLLSATISYSPVAGAITNFLRGLVIFSTTTIPTRDTSSSGTFSRPVVGIAVSRS